MNRKLYQINKSPKTTLSNSGDKSAKKTDTGPVADKIHGILKCLQTDDDKTLSDRGDVRQRAKASPKSLLADVAKLVLADKVKTVNRCSSIGNVTDECPVRMPTQPHLTSLFLTRQAKRAPAKPACPNGLCRDKCRITFEERQRLRQRYTFKLKTQHAPKEEEKVVEEEEDAKKIANRLKYYYLPNDNSLDLPRPRVVHTASKKGVTFQTDRPLSTFTTQVRPKRSAVTKLTKSTSPVKLRSMLSKVSIKAKRQKTKKKPSSCVRRSSSPELVNCLSPPTEIARWIPDAASVHAKPYYEAWVSTTLAAITQRSDTDDLYRQKKEIVQRLTRNHDAAVRASCPLTNSRCQFDEPQENWGDLVELPTANEMVVGRIRVKR